MGFRVDRTSEDLKRELTDIIRHVKDPRVSSILTIIKVTIFPTTCPTARCMSARWREWKRPRKRLKGLNPPTVLSNMRLTRASRCHIPISTSSPTTPLNTASIAKILNSLEIKQDEDEVEDEE